MEKKLRSLFDYQDFAKNADLQAVIDAVHGRYAARGDRVYRVRIGIGEGVEHKAHGNSLLFGGFMGPQLSYYTAKTV